MGRAKKVVPKHLAKKLEAIRKNLGLTYEELIAKLDCPEIPLYRASISQYESGKIEPPLPVLLKYAKLVNISTDALIDDNIELNEFNSM
jgi:transcriptional regulator with XRE-family HTH domain